jgi:hypothetical protein
MTADFPMQVVRHGSFAAQAGFRIAKVESARSATKCFFARSLVDEAQALQRRGETAFDQLDDRGFHFVVG